MPTASLPEILPTEIVPDWLGVDILYRIVGKNSIKCTLGLIRVFPEFNGEYIDNFFLFVYREKYAEFSDAIAICFRLIAEQFFNVDSEMRLAPQLRIGIFAKFTLNEFGIKPTQF
jgi:hypothetical protein